MKRRFILLVVILISMACSQPNFVSGPSRVETSLAEIQASATASAMNDPTPVIIRAPTLSAATDPAGPDPTLAAESGGALPQASGEVDAADCVPSRPPEVALVTKIVDGDTIEVVMNEQTYRVRYIGIDTPETGAEPMPFGEEATEKNRELVEGKPVTMYTDVSETDQFERLLRYVFVQDVFVNYDLVREGYARPVTYAPDVACAETFSQAGAEAQAAGAGLWSAGLALPTTVVSGSACPTGCMQEQPGCVIKGNINSEGEKIYHVPGGGSYNDTIISPENGERWFCTGGEAEANGWRRAGN